MLYSRDQWVAWASERQSDRHKATSDRHKAMPKKSAAMLRLLEVVEAENPLNDGASASGGNAAQKRRAEDEGGAGAAGGAAGADSDDEGEAMASGKVLPPRWSYDGVHDATAETQAEQGKVRKMVETEWAHKRDAEEREDECVRHTAVALSAAIFAAVQNTAKNLTKEAIVAAVVGSVPTKTKMLDHFEMVGVPAGYVQLGLWYNMQTFAALMQSLIELGLATGKTGREDASVLRFEEYTFEKSFWGDLLPRLYGVDSTDRRRKRSSTPFSTASAFWDMRNILGIRNAPQGKQPAATAVDRKVYSLGALTWTLCPHLQASNRHRFTDARMHKRDDAAERAGEGRANVMNPGSRKQVVLPDASVVAAHLVKRQRTEIAALKAAVIILSTVVSELAQVPVSAVVANLPGTNIGAGGPSNGAGGPSNGAGAAGK